MTAPTPEFHRAVDSLSSIGLEALSAAASLQSRRDRKYIVSTVALGSLLTQFGEDTRALDIDGVRQFRYESIYFDSADRQSYLDAARSRPARRKVRTRAYLDSSACALEVKARDRNGQTIKHRLDYPLSARHQLTDEAHRFISEVDPQGPDSAELHPTLTTSYRRVTLLIDAATSRTTIDLGLQCHDPSGQHVELTNHVLVETKSTTGSTSVDRLLWAHHIRPLKISKYCVGLAALHPELPANKWNRVLRSHFG